MWKQLKAPWLVDYITTSKRKGCALHVLKHVDGPHDDGSVVKKVSDGDVYLNAVFARQLPKDFSQLSQDEDIPNWDRSLIKINKCKVTWIEVKGRSEFQLYIECFDLWCLEEGFHSKQIPQDCNEVPEVKQKLDLLNSELRKTTPDKLGGDGEITEMSSLSLTQLLEELQEQKSQEPEQSPLVDADKEQSLSQKVVETTVVPNRSTARRLKPSSAMPDKLSDQFDIKCFLISQAEQDLVDAIAEWKLDYRPPLPVPETKDSSPSLLGDQSNIPAKGQGLSQTDSYSIQPGQSSGQSKTPRTSPKRLRNKLQRSAIPGETSMQNQSAQSVINGVLDQTRSGVIDAGVQAGVSLRPVKCVDRGQQMSQRGPGYVESQKTSQVASPITSSNEMQPDAQGGVNSTDSSADRLSLSERINQPQDSDKNGQLENAVVREASIIEKLPESSHVIGQSAVTSYNVGDGHSKDQVSQGLDKKQCINYDAIHHSTQDDHVRHSQARRPDIPLSPVLPVSPDSSKADRPYSAGQASKPVQGKALTSSVAQSTQISEVGTSGVHRNMQSSPNVINRKSQKTADIPSPEVEPCTAAGSVIIVSSSSSSSVIPSSIPDRPAASSNGEISASPHDPRMDLDTGDGAEEDRLYRLQRSTSATECGDKKETTRLGLFSTSTPTKKQNNKSASETVNKENGFVKREPGCEEKVNKSDVGIASKSPVAHDKSSSDSNSSFTTQISVIKTPEQVKENKMNNSKPRDLNLSISYSKTQQASKKTTKVDPQTAIRDQLIWSANTKIDIDPTVLYSNKTSRRNKTPQRQGRKHKLYTESPTMLLPEPVPAEGESPTQKRDETVLRKYRKLFSVDQVDLIETDMISIEVEETTDKSLSRETSRNEEQCGRPTGSYQRASPDEGKRKEKAPETNSHSAELYSSPEPPCQSAQLSSSQADASAQPSTSQADASAQLSTSQADVSAQLSTSQADVSAQLSTSQADTSGRHSTWNVADIEALVARKITKDQKRLLEMKFPSRIATRIKNYYLQPKFASKQNEK